MEQLERKALTVVLVLIAAALVVGVQHRLAMWPRSAFTLDPIAQTGALGAFLAAATLGLLFGMIGCPLCGVPLAACVSLRDQGGRHALAAVGLFNLGRLAIFLLTGTLAWFGWRIVHALAGGIGAMAVFCGVGLVMILLGIDLFAKREGKKGTGTFCRNGPEGEKGDRHLLPERPAGCFAQKGPVPFFPYMRYLLWGAGVGLACGMEALVFVLPAWGAMPAVGFAGAMLLLLVFCLAAFAPITLVVLSASFSVAMLRRITSPRVLIALRYVGGVVVMFFGTQFICAGIRGMIQS